MPNEIQMPGDVGATYYAQVVNASGQRWNGSAFESYVEANWGTYDVTLTEQGTSGLHVGTFPAVPAARYSVLVYQQSGGAPAVTDAPPVSSDTWDWDGEAVVVDSAEITPYKRGTVNGAVVAPAADGFRGDSSLSSVDEFYRGQYVAFDTGTLDGSARVISSYTGATRTFHFDGNAPQAKDRPFPAAPSDGDEFIIVGHG